MRKLLILLFVTSVIAQAVDLTPPSWRGDSYSTTQQWEFSLTDEPEPYATSWTNPFGPMQINIQNGWPVQYDYTQSAWRWDVNYGMGPSLLNIGIDTNWPGSSTNKLARVQVTWGVHFFDMNPPYDVGGMIYVSSNGLDDIFASGHFIDTQTLETIDSIEWYHTTFELVFAWGDLVYNEFGDVIDIISGESPYWSDLELYPDFPVFYPNPLVPEYTIYVSQIVVDTICVPEPLTILLLGLGGVALRSFRRF